MESEFNFKFENLTVYNKAMEFGEIVNKLTQKFPKEEQLELGSYFRRAADSIALDIAEGSSSTDEQFYLYLENACNSGHECISYSSKAKFRKYITFEEDEENRRMITELSKMINTLRNKILSRINNK
ncbi:four helix bundle protein [Aquimarina sp. 2201CG5-10]|uniref:four helix bundle protein n=1 Tax=Aquimarina callyspongiae TaxID=3098150 RepID=UPI002AB3A522|nr:four helix bundle protein [Aquimarina sp. 2201CG5-10]MDY8134584.1 four helix bundle protein [Aquimarina sp. 2201CG5-10]